MLRALWICLLAAAAACSSDDDPGADAPPALDTVVFVVRHAETTGAAVDPPLSATGQARAQTLAARLAAANIAAIYTSQYRRTRETATDVAAAAGVTIQIRMVDGTNAATYGTELATLVRDTNQSQAVLIVGHSNTVPDTVKALSGVTIAPIADTEYDHFFTITLSADGPHLDAAIY